MIRDIKHIAEALLVYLLYGIFKLFPYETASSIGGFIGRTIGPFVKASTVAHKNLDLIFPDMDRKEKKKIVKGTWDNLGRMAAELPHIASMPDNEFNQYMKIKNAPKNLKKGMLFVSAHYGNFELTARIFKRAKIPVYLVHRPANNVIVNNLINGIRKRHKGKMISKGIPGVRRMVKAFKNKESVAMLIDQKTNTGIEVPFMGHLAKTTPLPSTLIKKYGIPVYFFKISRKNKHHFEVVFSDPLKFKKAESSEEIMSELNSTIEKWIKNDPSQWFWVHKRWGKL